MARPSNSSGLSMCLVEGVIQYPMAYATKSNPASDSEEDDDSYELQIPRRRTTRISELTCDLMWLQEEMDELTVKDVSYEEDDSGFAEAWSAKKRRASASSTSSPTGVTEFLSLPPLMEPHPKPQYAPPSRSSLTLLNKRGIKRLSRSTLRNSSVLPVTPEI